MATDSFTSSAAGVSSAKATLSNTIAGGSKTYPLVGGWEVVCNSKGVYVSQAPSFGGTQAPITWPCTRDQARELALAILAVT